MTGSINRATDNLSDDSDMPEMSPNRFHQPKTGSLTELPLTRKCQDRTAEHTATGAHNG